MCEGEATHMGVDCTNCHSFGIRLKQQPYIKYKDLRSMLRHDGQTYLCGDCAMFKNEPDSYDVIEFAEVVGYTPRVAWRGHDLTLLDAAQLVGKRSKDGNTKTAIVWSGATYEASLEAYFE